MRPSRRVAVERRRRRSIYPKEAVELYLEAMVKRYQLAALVVATYHGFLLAGCGQGHDLGLLAALGVVKGRQVPGSAELIAELGRGLDLRTEPVELAGETFFVTSVGASQPLPETTGADLRRILKL